MYRATRHYGLTVRTVFYNGHRFQDHKITFAGRRDRHFQSVFVHSADRYPRIFSTGRHTMASPAPRPVMSLPHPDEW